MDNEKIKDIIKWYHVMGLDDMTRKVPESESQIDSKHKKDSYMAIPNKEIQINKNSLSRIIADNTKNLQDLKNHVMSFENCNLTATANNTVFSDGIETAPIMLIGEAPGQSEDEQGIPFCGASGLLLDKIIESIDISRRKNAYITNCIFWRPPANRRPTDEEIEICKPFVEKHIALINPKLLILVGATAVSALLGKQYQITKIRKEYFNYSNKYLKNHIITTAIFHPAYLLRQPLQKRDTWYDLLKIKDLIEKSL
jgi:uracil-DNA glycosylase family 4